MEKVKLFITGDRGFIGTKLKSIIPDEQIEVITFDGDLTNFERLDSFLATNKPDVALHLVGSFSNDFKELMKINVLTTQTLLSASVKNNVHKFVFASSGAVYGDKNTNRPYSELDKPVPTTLYGLSKLIAEDTFHFYERQFDIKATILRFPNIYFKAEGKGVVSTFMRDIEDRKEISITGNGEQRRDFLHVYDACEAMMLAVNSNESGVFNISSGLNLSLNEVVKKLSFKYEFQTKYTGNNNELNNLSLNFEKAKFVLKFAPKFLELDI